MDVEYISMKTKNGEENVPLIRYQDVTYPRQMITDPARRMREIYDLKYRDGDILFCSVPKSGIHWVGNMVLKLMGTVIDKNKSPFFGLEFHTVEQLSSIPSPRLILTHLLPTRLPQDHVANRGKVILLMRNPKDSVVSFYHHLKNAVSMSNKQTWEEFYDSAVRGIIPFGSHLDLIKAWYAELDSHTLGIQPEVFFYEDFITDCFNNLKRLDLYLGYSHTDEELRDIEQAGSLENLKAQSRTSKQHPDLLDKDGHTVIYRKGVIGDWKNHFTVAQNEQYDTIIQTALGGNAKKFKYVGTATQTDEELRDIEQAGSLENLKAQSRTSKQHPALLDKDGHTVIYRKGVIGDWKNHFTVAQNEQYDMIIQTALGENAKKFKYVV